MPPFENQFAFILFPPFLKRISQCPGQDQLNGSQMINLKNKLKDTSTHICIDRSGFIVNICWIFCKNWKMHLKNKNLNLDVFTYVPWQNSLHGSYDQLHSHREVAHYSQESFIWKANTPPEKRREGSKQCKISGNKKNVYLVYVVYWLLVQDVKPVILVRLSAIWTLV